VALSEARATAEATLLLEAMRAALLVRPDEAVASEARALVARLSASLPDERSRARFLERSVIP
jgi:hypothetical protein